jgi:hypothetical protein
MLRATNLQLYCLNLKLRKVKIAYPLPDRNVRTRYYPAKQYRNIVTENKVSVMLDANERATPDQYPPFQP